MPGTIAILGASTDRRKYGNKCVRAYLEEGWRVFPVNPNAPQVEEQPAYPKLELVPETVDRVAVYLPPAVSRQLLPAIARAAPGEVIFNPGSADPEVLAEAHRLGLPARNACAIVDIGRSPSEFGA